MDNFLNNAHRLQPIDFFFFQLHAVIEVLVKDIEYHLSVIRPPFAFGNQDAALYCVESYFGCWILFAQKRRTFGESILGIRANIVRVVADIGYNVEILAEFLFNSVAFLLVEFHGHVSAP